MMKQQKMGYCYYKKIAIAIIIGIMLQVSSPATLFASYILWPSEMNLSNEAISLDMFVATTSTSSNSKKGFFFTGEAGEVFTLGAGHIAVNVTLSGKGHAFVQLLKGFKERGIEITLVLVNDKAPVGVSGKGAPKEYETPYCYMIDFFATNGDWQKYNFDRILDDYGEYVDNWIIGNEINSQAYNFYGPADIEEYTKVYCDSFKIMYRDIKEKNPNANLFISFDQGWDQPQFRINGVKYDPIRGKYRYNIKEQLSYINKYLGKYIDWGISLHPYPNPVSQSTFWDDDYAGYDLSAIDDKDKAYLLTTKNFEIALDFINDRKYLYRGIDKRKVIISEIGFTSHDGEEIQAAALYYLWEKIKKYEQIKAFIYNAQTDLNDGYNFGLTSDKKRKRLIWAVFRDMDKDISVSAWCKDLLDRVLEEHGYEDIDTILISKEEKEKLSHANTQGKLASIIFSDASK